jgi:prevent-host-death family protein
METFTIHEAKAKLSELIEAALSGEEIIIARRKTPLVKIVPLSSSHADRRLGTARGMIQIADDFNETPDDFKDYL